MTVEAVFELSSEELLFGALLGESASLTFEIERVVPTGGQVMPYVWVSGADVDAFEDIADETHDVESVRLLDRVDDSALYRIEWRRDTEQFVAGIFDTGGTVVEASGSSEWLFRLRFEESTDLSAFQTHCRDHEIQSHLQRVHSVTQTTTPQREFGLTEAQYEAVLAAHRAGYFEVPRGVTYADLAEELDISQQAVSERVRRGVNKILGETLAALI
ncbi:bacterio-opsin activator domain-containing protein [Haloarcula marina]|uniref:helix-turn-helix domain-containing protein n=1 Tax=Haloarcula marina TaxID=2961574 RepID=UPI0020B6C008|nr:bacterio-opsin activator domain-containing protein [Halomicroarcula marina]